MDPRITQELNRLDFDGSGKVDIADARALLDRELAKAKPARLAGASFIAGLVIGFFAGRASK
jgi:hypothetical protein